MSNRSFVRRERRNGVSHLIIDFSFIDKEGRRQRYRRDATAPTMAGARAEAERLRALAAATGSPHGKPAAPTFAAFVADTFLPLFASRLRPASQEHYQRLLHGACGLVHEFGSVTLEAFADGQLLRRYAAARLARGVTARAQVSLVASVLRAAVNCGQLDAMPPIPREKESAKLPDAPALAEVDAMLGHADGWLRLGIALAAYAGLRSGECRALRVADVDLDAGVITVRRTFSGSKLMAGGKGGKERTVPIAAPLLPLLREAARDALPSAHVLRTRLGTVPPSRRLYHGLQALLARHGLPRRSFHQLRHAFCSALLSNGATIEVVRLLAGHSRLATTGRYLHAQAGELTSAIRALNGNSLEMR